MNVLRPRSRKADPKRLLLLRGRRSLAERRQSGGGLSRPRLARRTYLGGTLGMNGQDRARMEAHLERVDREEREEAAARLHGQRHDTIDSPDECERCMVERLNVEGDPTRNGAFR